MISVSWILSPALIPKLPPKVPAITLYQKTKTHRAAAEGQSRGVELRVFSNWFPSSLFCDLKRLVRDLSPTAARLGQAEPPSGSHTSSTIPENVVFQPRQ